MYNCKYCNKECKNDNSLRNHERLCKQNPNRQLTTYEKYGPISGFNEPGHLSWNKGLKKESDPRVNKISTSLKTFYETRPSTFAGKKHSEEAKKLISIAASINNLTKFDKPSGRGKRGNYKGVYCQSSWELAYVLFCIDHNINFIRNNKYFEYEFEGKVHNYFPDFYLPDSDTYVEVKGYYDKRSKAKFEQFKGTLQLLTLKEMKPILEYVENKYGKDFINLYD